MGLSSDEGLHVETDDKSQLPHSSLGHSPHFPTSVHVLAWKNERGQEWQRGKWKMTHGERTNKDTMYYDNVLRCVHVYLCMALQSWELKCYRNSFSTKDSDRQNTAGEEWALNCKGSTHKDAHNPNFHAVTYVYTKAFIDKHVPKLFHFFCTPFLHRKWPRTYFLLLSPESYKSLSVCAMKILFYSIWSNRKWPVMSAVTHALHERHVHTHSGIKKKSHPSCEDTWGQGVRRNKHIFQEIHMLYSCHVDTHTHTQSEIHTQQSRSPRLWEWLGLPDLHSCRYVYRGDEISRSLLLCLSLFHILCSFQCLFIVSWSHTHTHSRGEETTMISWLEYPCTCRWNW